jgi:hypothetical protein
VGQKKLRHPDIYWFIGNTNFAPPVGSLHTHSSMNNPDCYRNLSWDGGMRRLQLLQMVFDLDPGLVYLASTCDPIQILHLKLEHKIAMRYRI